MNCKSCKHFDDLAESVDSCQEHRLGLGKCKKVKHLDDHFTYDDNYKKPVLTNDDLAFVRDASDYMAHLFVKPEFGCTQFEPNT